MKANSSLTSRIAICLVMSLAATAASARTVYDAGKALRKNFTENATPANPYTDENGGKWYYSSAAGVAPYTSLGNFASSYAKIDNDQLQGWGDTSSPHLKVNITGHTLTSSSFMTDGCEPIEADEMMFHPGGSGNSYMVLRFVAPEAGWYSAFASFHDTSAEATASASSGASVYVGVGANDVCASGVVSIEGATNSTKRFDFQMPVRYLAKDTEIRFTVGNNGAHSSDGTGVKVFVVKEDEGAFYDSGIAMLNNVAASPYANPYGTIADGTWYSLTATAPAAQTAPDNVSQAAGSRITTAATSSTYLKGFANNASGQSPFVLVNTASSRQGDVAPGEIKMHPKAGDSSCKTWTVLRFRPPESGYYSASIVARDVDRANLTSYPSADGVDVYLYVADTLVTNAYVSLETPVAATAHLTFDRRFMVAGEPVDIVVSPHGQINNDATGVSAIFRREEGDVYDAGKSFYADHAGGGTTDSFADLLGGATWRLGAKTNAWCGSQFYEELTTFNVASGSKTKWWMQGRYSSWDQFPYFLMITNGVASADSGFGISADLFAVSPYEFAARPNDSGYQSSSPTIKATVPADGVYRVRSCVRDLNNSGGDGIRASVVANNYVADSAAIQRLASGGELYESVLSADRLWLKAGDRIEYVVDPLSGKDYDQTGLTACYERTGDASAHVVNIDVTGTSGSGRYSSITSTAREGWSNWKSWNAIRFSSSLPQTSSRMIENCREADGKTKRNVTFTIARNSGEIIQKGYGNGPTGLHNIWVASEGSGDTYTLRLSKLKKNEPYTLWLYSAKATAAGNATFTVGGVTKGVEEPWSLGATNMVTRFETLSDANGRIIVAFAAASDEGGAFNGLTLVGEFPEYIEPGMFITVR